MRLKVNDSSSNGFSSCNNIATPHPVVPTSCKDLQVEALKYSLGCSSSKCYIPLFQMMPSTLERLGKQEGIFFSFLGNK